MIGRQLLAVPGEEVRQPLADLAAIDLEVAVEVAAELGEVGADVVLGEHQHVVAHAGEQARKELLFGLFGGAGHLLHQVVGGGQDAVEEAVADPVLDGVAHAAADLQVLAQDALGGLLEQPGDVAGVVEPEHRRIEPAGIGDGGVLHRAHQQHPVALPGGVVDLPVVGVPPLDGQLHAFFTVDVVTEGRGQRQHALGQQHRKAVVGSGALVFEEDGLGQRQGALQVGHQARDLLGVAAQEVERSRQQREERRRVHALAQRLWRTVVTGFGYV